MSTDIDLRVQRDQFSFSWMVSLTLIQSKNMMRLFFSSLFVHPCLSQLVFFECPRGNRGAQEETETRNITLAPGLKARRKTRFIT